MRIEDKIQRSLSITKNGINLINDESLSCLQLRRAQLDNHPDFRRVCDVISKNL